MKTKQDVITTRAMGLRHFDHAVALVGREGVIRRTGEIIKEFANMPNMPLCFSWAMRNALDEIIDPKRDISMPFNADEVFTSAEIEHLETFGMKLDPKREFGPRKKGVPVSDEAVIIHCEQAAEKIRADLGIPKPQ